MFVLEPWGRKSIRHTQCSLQPQEQCYKLGQERKKKGSWTGLRICGKAGLSLHDTDAFSSYSKPARNTVDSSFSDVAHYPAAGTLLLSPSHPLSPSGDAERVCPTCLPWCWSAGWTGGVPQCKETSFFFPISLEIITECKNNKGRPYDHVTLCSNVVLTDCRQMSYLF